MKARVYVTFKQSVLDPQGQTIRAALKAGNNAQAVADAAAASVWGTKPFTTGSC